MKKIIVCKECFVSDHIKLYIEHNVEDSTEKCVICRKNNGVDVFKNDRLLKMIEYLVYYNYAMLDYSKNIGGAISNRFRNIFGEANPIFNGILNDNRGFELLERIEANQISDVDHWMLPFKEVKSPILKRMEKDLSKRNYYEIIKVYIEIFEKHLNKFILNEIPDETLFRARIGFNTKIVNAEGDLKNIKISFPFINDELEAPPPMKSSCGRFNRLGCSFLYLASDIETAIAEIKPDPGQICSVASFKIVEKKSSLI